MDKELSYFFSRIEFVINIAEEAQKKLNNYLAIEFNVFDIISPDENRLSDIIADLLNVKGSHGQGDLFLDKFLDFNNIVKFYDLRNVKIIREGSTTFIEQYQRRIDITLDFQDGLFGIGIENKPWAGPQDDQLKHYNTHLKKKFNDNYILIYISGDGSDPPITSIDDCEKHDLRSKEKLKIISYSPNLKNWIRQCFEVCRSEKVRWFLHDFEDYINNKFTQVLGK